MKQTFTSARRPLEVLIHIISWGIMFGFPFFFVERGNGNINWMAYTRHLAVPLSFMIVFYVNYFILVPRYLFQSQAKDMWSTILSFYAPSVCCFISGKV